MRNILIAIHMEADFTENLLPHAYRVHGGIEVMRRQNAEWMLMRADSTVYPYSRLAR